MRKTVRSDYEQMWKDLEMGIDNSIEFYEKLRDMSKDKKKFQSRIDTLREVSRLMLNIRILEDNDDWFG